MTYLDHAATSPLRPEAAEAFAEASLIVGNASALHRAGQRARARLEEAREELAAAVEAHPSEVIFTSGGSEADSLAVLGSWHARPGRDRALISAVEHPAVLQAAERGAETIPVTPAGVVDLAAAEALLDERVAVVSVMTVNNETGVLPGADEVRRAAHAVGAWMHSDAVQALGHLPLSFRASGFDLASLSGHKVGAPVGIGALLARREAGLRAVGLGGGQEREVRSGTLPVALAASFAAAATAAVSELPLRMARWTQWGERVAAACRELGGRVTSHEAPHAPHIVNVTFPRARADDVLFLLDQRSVFASVGSACRAGVHQPSEVLIAMGRSVDEASWSLRFSFGHSTLDDDVARLCEVLPEVVAQAQRAY
ncbi:MAG TPA: aminotransferase class V-fold PLP-dependent enzyme [Arachnia sp.]|nr:aminotransferase class V-fold PLP-dependent enzyme [Arachnia sp.]HMT85902.1 aminotransferase class V-fold PLP-dependent enzyme [Arachnia sp.]